MSDLQVRDGQVYWKGRHIDRVSYEELLQSMIEGLGKMSGAHCILPLGHAGPCIERRDDPVEMINRLTAECDEARMRLDAEFDENTVLRGERDRLAEVITAAIQLEPVSATWIEMARRALNEVARDKV